MRRGKRCEESEREWKIEKKKEKKKGKLSDQKGEASIYVTLCSPPSIISLFIYLCLSGCG